MRILTLDIENRPNLGFIWDLWNQNLSLPQVVEHAETICFAAKWHDKKKVEFYSTFHHGKEEMVAQAHRLLSEADIVVGYNSNGFDLKHLNREMLLGGYTPPAPYQKVDLYQVVKKQFKFSSNKLDNILQQLDLGSKVQHSGWKLWIDCMADDPKAWAKMRQYNKNDVVKTEVLYDRLLPWIPSHPAVGLYEDMADVCPACGGGNLRLEGRAYTLMGVYQRYSCSDCGKWSRGNKRLEGSNVRGL